MARLEISMAVLATALLGLSGCNGEERGESGPPSTQVVTHILSDPGLDGDIEELGPGACTVTQGMSANVQTVLAGLDSNAATEFRAFLDFPLTGPNGVPAEAVIDSASLEFRVDDLEPSDGSIPMRIELVSFEPPTLYGIYFDPNSMPAFGAVILPAEVTGQDIGHSVTVDVPSLMVEAQSLKLTDFQVRVMEDFGPTLYTLTVIDDSTASDRAQRAPVLTVTYH